MDILKIRKKSQGDTAAKKQGAEPPAPSEASTAPRSEPPAEPPARPPRAPTRTPIPTPNPTPAPARALSLPPPPVAEPALAPPLAPPRPRPTREERERALADVDPLAEFLARYDDGAEALEVESAVDAQRDEHKRFLAFELAGEEYAASIMDIREILRVLSLTPVPRAPRDILGVISKRGIVMPVVDLAAVLGLRDPDPRWDARQRILAAGEGERVCGLRVDRVLEVIRLRVDDIEEVPASLGARTKHQLKGLGRVKERMFILLDVQAVLHGMAVAAGIEAREEVQ